MDDLSALLQESKPVYLQYKHERIRAIKCVCVVICFFIIPIIAGITSNRYNIDSVYADLYPESNTHTDKNQSYYIDEFDAIGVI